MDSSSALKLVSVVGPSPSRPPKDLLTKETASARVFADHALLRGIAGALGAAARGALNDEKQRFTIRCLLAQLVSENDAHTAFEEQVIHQLVIPAPASTAPASTAALDLAKEHADQRSVLTALVDDAEDGVRPIRELVEEILWFLERFESDMNAEEAVLVRA